MTSLAVANPDQQQIPASRSSFERRLFFVLAFVALIYAFVAGLRTVQDFDLGWQMATGRWVLQHHHVPSTDVLSYTMQGQPFLYPVGAGVFFYLGFLVGGYKIISWIGAAACVATVALLLRRNTATGAAIAILAVPLIAARTLPRAEMFTIVFFAAFFSLLWENYHTGNARLWILLLLMLVWVNVHYGFAAGLVLILAYVAGELLRTISIVERQPALQRLRRAWPWLACTALATLANPWGWRIYHGLMVQQHANAEQQLWINEWAPVPVNWANISRAILLRQTSGTIYLLLAVALIGVAVALLRSHWTSAILLLGSAYPAMQAVRMGAVFACVVVIVAGAELASALSAGSRRLPSLRTREMIAGVAAAIIVALAGLRCFDLVTNRHYMVSADEAVFGAGLCSWFPERAVEFIERQKLPGEILNTYAAGGFLAWRLGPEQRVYIDGRDTLYGSTQLSRHSQLMFSSPESQFWQDEASRYNINTFVLALARADGVPPTLLRGLCSSTMWRPVYLDERSAVFVRETPQTEELIQRFPVDCATAALPVSDARDSRAQQFNTWSNTAMTLAAIGRNSEAEAAYQKALAIFPGSAFVHRNYGDLLFAMGKMGESEEEYLAAIKLEPSADTWGALARSYLQRSRMLAAADAMEHEAQFSPRPYLTLDDLGYLYLSLNDPQQALKAFDRAARLTPRALKAADNGFFEFKVAQGQSAAWDALGNLEKATAYQEQAANLQPSAPQPWRRLAQLYERGGRSEDADRARQHAAQLSQAKP
ncbi:MAG TPA: tetratricopeptide repeat protein [Terriglobales bacterium]|nr:tetratricopeptide repeat protein [Terriglobales bacterium]